MLSTTLLLASSLAITTATNLYIADYSGQLTTVSLTESKGNYSISQTSVDHHCAPNPSWLTIDPNRGLLFCLNEGLQTVNGSLSSYTIGSNGALKHIKNATTINGPVSGVIYGNPSGQRGLVLAHYVGSAVSTWLLDGKGTFTHNEDFVYTLDGPGPVPDRQDAPHEHEAILDPTGQYILVPDLGADLVRVYSWDQETLKLTALDPLKAEPGTGPRHAAFWNPYSVACEGCTTFFYLVGELAASVTSYAVTYKPNGGGLEFEQVFNSTTYGLLNLPPGTAPAEVHVSPDNKYLTISNRGDNAFTLLQPDNTFLKSDSLATFQLQEDGTLVWHQIWPAGGSFPRHYSMNAPGTLVAVGLQYDQDVRILQRDPSTGLIGEPVAVIPVGGNVTCVVFNEEKALGVLGG
jgi:6-phosphogluconolactonase (cycloisomerase 2 family)